MLSARVLRTRAWVLAQDRATSRHSGCTFRWLLSLGLPELVSSRPRVAKLLPRPSSLVLGSWSPLRALFGSP